MTQTFFFMIMTALVISNYLQVPVCPNYKAFTNTYLVFIVKWVHGEKSSKYNIEIKLGSLMKVAAVVKVSVGLRSVDPDCVPLLAQNRPIKDIY